jgi:hypothetical protein
LAMALSVLFQLAAAAVVAAVAAVHPPFAFLGYEIRSALRIAAAGHSEGEAAIELRGERGRAVLLAVSWRERKPESVAPHLLR